jgi:hypothetical protein
MKLIVFAAIILIFTAAGCTGGTSSSPGITEQDLFLYIDGAPYRLGINIESVIADFGGGYKYAEARSCDYDGLDKTFIYEMAEFYTFPLSNGDMVSEVYSDNPLASTSKGIRVGSSKEEVLKAYGSDGEYDGYQLIYALEGGSLCFDLDGGAVTGFYVTRRVF